MLKKMAVSNCLSVNNSRNSEEVLRNDKRTLVGTVDLRAKDSKSGALVCCPSHHAPKIWVICI